MPLLSPRKEIKSWVINESINSDSNHIDKPTAFHDPTTTKKSNFGRQHRLMTSQNSMPSVQQEGFHCKASSRSNDKLDNRLNFVKIDNGDKGGQVKIKRAYSVSRSSRPTEAGDGNTLKERGEDHTARRATLNLTAEHKSTYKRRLFSLFSKENNTKKSLDERPNIHHKKRLTEAKQNSRMAYEESSCWHVPKKTLSDNRSKPMTISTPTTCVQTVLESLAANSEHLKFSVAPLDDSLVDRGMKHCFQISTYFPSRKLQAIDKSMGDRAFHLDKEAPVPPPPSRSTVRMRQRPINRRLDKQQSEPHPAPESAADIIQSIHRIYSCQSDTERVYWIHKFHCLSNPKLFSEKRNDNSLYLCLQEIKGVIIGKQYFCEVYLDDVLYARTSIKTMKDMLAWGEEFKFSQLPNVFEIHVLLWLVKMGSDDENGPEGFHEQSLRRASLPRSGMLDGERTHSISIPHEDSWASMMYTSSSSLETIHCLNISSSSSLLKNEGFYDGDQRRQRKKTNWRRKTPNRFFLVAEFSIPTTEINDVTDTEAWYSNEARKRGSLSDLELVNGCSPNPLSSSISATSAKRLSLKTGRFTKNIVLSTTQVRLRMKACYTSLVALPICAYSQLQAQLLSGGVASEGSHSVVVLLRSLEPYLSVKSKATLAQSLLAMHHLRRQVPAFLSSLVLSEVKEQDNPNMVLRSNSLATKAIELYLRQAGEPYLKAALGDFVEKILKKTTSSTGNKLTSSQNRSPPSTTATIATRPSGQKEKRNSLGKRLSLTRVSSGNNNNNNVASAQERGGGGCDILEFEVDPVRVTNSSQLLVNQKNLTGIVQLVWRRIQDTVPVFPVELRRTFAAIREVMLPKETAQDRRHRNRGEGNGEEKGEKSWGPDELFEHVVSACVFLRFLCPAILSPSLFGLADGFPEDVRVIRTFTLVAKTIQNLANFTLFGDVKEMHMGFLNRFVADQLPAMRAFLWRISDPLGESDSSPSSASSSASPVPTYSARLVDVYSVCETAATTRSLQQHRYSKFASVTNPRKHRRPGIMADSLTFSKSATESSIGEHCNSKEEFDDSLEHVRSVIKTSIANGLSSTSLSSSVDDDVKITIDRHTNQLTGLPDLLSDASVCGSAIYAIPSTLLANRHSPATDQLDLANCLARCHLQLTAALEKVPSEQLSAPLQKLWNALSRISTLIDSNSFDWDTESLTTANTPKASFNRTPLVSQMNSLSFEHNPDEPTTPRPVANPPTPPLAHRRPFGKTKSATALVSATMAAATPTSKPSCQSKVQVEYVATFHTVSEPGPLVGRQSWKQHNVSLENNSRQGQSEDTVGDSFWSLHNPSSRSPALPTTTNQNSSTESDASLPRSFDFVTLPHARPSNRPIMGTSLYGGQSADRRHIQRSPSNPVHCLDPVISTTQRRLKQSSISSYNPMYAGAETQRPALISVQTQTVRFVTGIKEQTKEEEVTELDDDPKRLHTTSSVSFSSVEKRSHSKPQRRHTYINLLDDFDDQLNQLDQW